VTRLDSLPGFLPEARGDVTVHPLRDALAGGHGRKERLHYLLTHDSLKVADVLAHVGSSSPAARRTV